MKVLIIHPTDFTTDFLKESYSGLECTLINSLTVSKKILKQAIKNHDKIIIMGHGDSKGLFGKNRYIINSELVYLLRDKKETAYIWCHADQFCSKYDLAGFKTGMIISDFEEALMYAVQCTGAQITESNQMFATALKASITGPLSEIVAKIKGMYFSDNNPVIQFNEDNLHYS